MKASEGHLYILEPPTWPWLRGWFLIGERTDLVPGELMETAQTVFARAMWSGAGEWRYAYIPLQRDGLILACHEQGGPLYVWSTHELPWLTEA
jgi:hypothetical protein